jgi:hypothetical protein
LGLDRVSILRPLAMKLSHLIAKSPTGRRRGQEAVHGLGAGCLKSTCTMCFENVCLYCFGCGQRV